MNEFQLNEKVVISKNCPYHGGKQGRFQFITTIGKIDFAIVQDSSNNRQFKVGVEYVEKT
jgi:hypothetical protein